MPDPRSSIGPLPSMRLRRLLRTIEERGPAAGLPMTSVPQRHWEKLPARVPAEGEEN